MTLTLDKIKNLKSDKIGFFRFKKFDKDSYLITNEIGEYSFLTYKEFEDFIAGKIKSGEKYDELLLKGFIKNEKYKDEMAIKYATKNHFLGFGPSLHIIVTTLRCNHRCVYCHASIASEKAKGLDMDKETATKVIDSIFYTSKQSLTIEFQGGEPLFNFDIIKYIVEYANIKSYYLSKPVKFALVTNLTLMDNDKLKYLFDNNISISTSLDGDEISHNSNRILNNGNSFQKVTYWIKKINKEYKKRGIKYKMGALLTITKNALPKYKEIINTYVDLGLNSIFLRLLNPYGFAAVDLNKIGYSIDDFIEFYIKSMDYILELNKKGTFLRESLSSIYLLKIFNIKDPNFLDIRSPCGACVGQVAYNYDGKIYSCDEGRMLGRMGDDNFLITETKSNGEETYMNMINSITTKVMVQASTIDGLPGYNDSVYKPYIGVCPIYSYKKTGNIIPNFGKDAKMKLDFAILDYLFDKIRDKENEKIFKNWLNFKF